ncbi:hypothetical protein D3C75_1262830 [compost metagenome]
MTFFFFLVVAIANQNVFVVLLRHNIHGFDQRTKERIGNIHDHHADGVAHLRG